MPLAMLPGMTPVPPPTLAEPVVRISVDGVKFKYALTEDDVCKVFRRYGEVKRVIVSEEGSSAVVIFHDTHVAQAAMYGLNGKSLTGLDGTLHVEWVCWSGEELLRRCTEELKQIQDVINCNSGVYCDKCDKTLVVGPSWYHKPGSDEDLCYPHWQELQEVDRAAFINVSDFAELGADRAFYEVDDAVSTAQHAVTSAGQACAEVTRAGLQQRVALLQQVLDGCRAAGGALNQVHSTRQAALDGRRAASGSSQILPGPSSPRSGLMPSGPSAPSCALSRSSPRAAQPLGESMEAALFSRSAPSSAPFHFGSISDELVDAETKTEKKKHKKKKKKKNTDATAAIEDGGSSMTEEATLTTVLAHAGLASFRDAFLENGFDTIDVLRSLDDSDCHLLGLKQGHRKKLQMAIAALPLTPSAHDGGKATDEKCCVVCLDADASHAFDPCFHRVTCEACSQGLKVCPVCRTAVRRRVRIYD